MNKKDKNYYLGLWQGQRCGVITDLHDDFSCTIKITGEPIGDGPKCTGCPYYNEDD